MFFINSSGTIGVILAAGAQNTTGDIVSTLLAIYLFLLIICLMFRVPIEFTIVIMLPLTIAIAAYYSNFLSLLIIMGIYLCTLLAKNWLFK